MNNVSIIGVEEEVAVRIMEPTGPVADGRQVRVMRKGEAVWGRREGEEIVLDSGNRLPEAEAHYLAPAQPSKIIAVHRYFNGNPDAARISVVAS
jgi:hypothetical protein